MSLKTNVSVAVVGAGFAGIRVALGLANQGFKVCLFNDSAYHLVLPELYGVLSHGASSKCRVLLRTIFAGKSIEIKVGRVLNVDIDKKEVQAVDDNGQDISGAFEMIVVSAGLSSSDSFDRFSRAQDLAAAMRQPGVKRVGIIGAGPTGIELASCLRDFFSELAPEIQLFDSRKFHLPLLQPGQIFDVRQELSRHQIYIHDQVSIQGIQSQQPSGPATIQVAELGLMKVDVLAHATGRNQATLALKAKEIRVGPRGTFGVNQFLELGSGVWGIGDAVHVEGLSVTESQWRGTAQSAIREADHVVEQIVQKKQFDFKPGGMGYLLRMPGFCATGVIQGPFGRLIPVSGKVGFGLKMASHVRYRWSTWAQASLMNGPN